MDPSKTVHSLAIRELSTLFISNQIVRALRTLGVFNSAREGVAPTSFSDLWSVGYSLRSHSIRRCISYILWRATFDLTRNEGPSIQFSLFVCELLNNILARQCIILQYVRFVEHVLLFAFVAVAVVAVVVVVVHLGCLWSSCAWVVVVVVVYFCDSILLANDWVSVCIYGSDVNGGTHIYYSNCVCRVCLWGLKRFAR